ncbi:MAG: SDR family NAD(P)-dependent oxidoreductase, partial [Gammaproteobacteria bacterium]|nr:SDR family NAD(P)-dependent oxidoreductase [Gammaproteobacteria bacterium]
MKKLEGRRALITGGARGIGRAIAKSLVGEGAEVLINYHSSGADAQSLAEELSAAGGRAVLFKGDVG